LSEPWHYTTALDFLDHWQTLSAGLVGFAAGIVVVVVTLRIERRSREWETDALRTSLAYELRLLVPRALGAYQSLMGYAQDPGTAITGRMVRYGSRLPVPIIYPANAEKIGLLGSDAMAVVIIYSLIELARQAAEDLENDRDPDHLSPESVAAVAGAFLEACNQARDVLPRLQTGHPGYDERDQVLIQTIIEQINARQHYNARH
jgi:hypothetical protein